MTEENASTEEEQPISTTQALAVLVNAVPIIHQVSLSVWGAAELKHFAQRIGQKLEATPPEHINTTPKANVVASALEAVRLTGDEVDLQEAFANLIARAMDKRVADGVFPAFVEILKQLTSDEAKLLRFFQRMARHGGIVVPIIHIQQEEYDDGGRRIAGLDVVKNRSSIGRAAGCVYPKQVPSYLDNLARLGIVQFHAPGTKYADQEVYREVEFDSENLALREQFEQPPRYRSKYVYSGLELTTFGRHFIDACVKPFGPA